MSLAFAGVFCIGQAAAVRAQARRPAGVVVVPLSVAAHQGLTFGTVLPGIPAVVHANDAMRAMLFEVEGAAGLPVRVEFVLPAVLARIGGTESIPLAFGAGDGIADPNHAPGSGITFDPRLPLISTLGSAGQLWLSIGATAVPGHLLTTGQYHGTVYITVYDLSS